MRTGWTEKRENVRKIEPEWEGTERWGVVLVLWSLSASECQEWKLVIWCDHTYLTTHNRTGTGTLSVCLGVYLLKKTITLFHRPEWRPLSERSLSYTRTNLIPVASESIHCEAVTAHALGWGLNISGHNAAAEQNSLTDPRPCDLPLLCDHTEASSHSPELDLAVSRLKQEGLCRNQHVRFR